MAQIRGGRRWALRVLGGAAIAPVWVRAARCDGEQTGWIDAHVHVWTDDVRRYPLADGYRADQMDPPTFTPETLLAHAEPVGVRRIVLIQMSYYGTDNSYMLDTVRRFPGRFGAVAVVDVQSKDLRQSLADLAAQQVRGIRIAPAGKPVDSWLDDSAGYAELWRGCAEEGMAVCPLIDADYLPAVWQMCQRFPKTRVVIDHFARIGIDGTIRDGDLSALCRLSEFPNTYVKLSAFYALGKKVAPYRDLVPMIRRVYGSFGADRLMWATDAPYQVLGGHRYGDSLALIRDDLDFVDAQDRAKLLRTTAEKVFFS